MGLGRLLHNRNLVYDVTNTETGATDSFEVVMNRGIYADWSNRHYRGGMNIPGAYRAALIISDLLGSVPWDAYRRRGGRPVELLDPTPTLLEQPSPEETRMDTFSSWALDLVWEGNAVAIIADRNYDGTPTALLPVPAHMVSARRVGPGAYAGGLPVGAIEYNIGGRAFAPHEVLHFKGPHAPGELRGMGVLELHLAETLALAAEQGRQARSISQHGVPTGTLKSENPDLTQKEADDLKAQWLKSQRDRTVAVLNATTEFHALAWDPEKLQLVDARKFTLQEVALIFGLPLSFLGADQSSRTYTNVEQEGLNLLKYTLRGHLARFEQTLSALFPRGTYVKANLDELLRADTITRYQAYAVGLDKQFLTHDEVREKEDMPPLPEPPEPEPQQQPDVIDGEVVGQQQIEAGRVDDGEQ